MTSLLLGAFFLCAQPAAADDAAPGAAPASAQAPVSSPRPKAGDAQDYHLTNLQPVSVSTYPTGVATVLRNYLHFRNRDGNHYLVVEEDSDAAPIKEVASLQQIMASPTADCELDLSCQKKAFCVGKCTSMYYQISNVSSARVPAGRCHLVSFTCDQSRDPASTK